MLHKYYENVYYNFSNNPETLNPLLKKSKFFKRIARAYNLDVDVHKRRKLLHCRMESTLGRGRFQGQRQGIVLLHHLLHLHLLDHFSDIRLLCRRF